MKPLKIGIVGAGRLGQIHARKLAAMPNVQVVTIVDADRTRCEQLAGELQAQAADTHLELQGKVDAAIVATPATTHYRITKELLERRIHTFVEKPLATRVLEADHLTHLAEDQHAILQVGHIERFNPAWNQALTEVVSPRYLEARRMGKYTFRAADVGVVLDLMIHDIDLILSMVPSEIVSVEAQGFSILGPHEDAAFVMLSFANGCRAHLSASRVSPDAERTMRVYCEDRFATIDFQTNQVDWIRLPSSLPANRLKICQLSATQRQAIENDLFATVLPRTVTSVSHHDGIRSELQDFLASIQCGVSPRVTGSQARDALAVTEWILDQLAVNQQMSEKTRAHEAAVTPSAEIFRPRIWQADLDAVHRKAG